MLESFFDELMVLLPSCDFVFFNSVPRRFAQFTLLDKVSAHPKIVGTSHIVHKCKQKLITIEPYYYYINHNTLDF